VVVVVLLLLLLLLCLETNASAALVGVNKEGGWWSRTVFLSSSLGIGITAGGVAVEK